MSIIHAGEAADAHCNAINAAFYELGLRWHWDRQMYAALPCQSEEKALLHAYLRTHQPHMLAAYDADFLIAAIQDVKTRRLAAIDINANAAGNVVNWAPFHQTEIGI